MRCGRAVSRGLRAGGGRMDRQATRSGGPPTEPLPPDPDRHGPRWSARDRNGPARAAGRSARRQRSRRHAAGSSRRWDRGGGGRRSGLRRSSTNLRETCVHPVAAQLFAPALARMRDVSVGGLSAAGPQVGPAGPAGDVKIAECQCPAQPELRRTHRRPPAPPAVRANHSSWGGGSPESRSDGDHASDPT